MSEHECFPNPERGWFEEGILVIPCMFCDARAHIFTKDLEWGVPLRRAIVMSDCDEAGNPIPGTEQLATPWLDQNEYWKTAEGQLLRLENMTYRHRRNTINWLERNAFMIMLDYDQSLLTGPWAPKDDLIIDQWMDEECTRDPIDRLRETPLYQRLVHLNKAEDENRKDSEGNTSSSVFRRRGFHKGSSL